MSEKYTLHLGDCLEVMREIPAASVDSVVTDPPYGTTACKWDSVIPFAPMWAELKRITKPTGAIVLFGSQPFTSALIMSNPAMFRCEWIWSKSNGGGFLNANRYPLKRHENVIVFGQEAPTYNPQKTKGKSYRCRSSAAGETTQDQTVAGWITENGGDRFPNSVIYYVNETGLHPTQKPVALMRYLIRTYTNEEETVLDFTMGSGTTGEAAIKENRRFIGIERDETYFAIAQKRIESAAGAYQPALF